MTSKSMFDQVRDFHTAFGLPVSRVPKLPSADERVLRIKLLGEEFTEYSKGESENDLVNIASELADILYIVFGTAHSYGIPIDKVFEAIHNANMAKLDESGQPIRREDGKVLKPAGWKPADIKAILVENGYDE